MPKKQCIGKVFVVGSYHVTVEDVIAEGGFALVFLTRDNAGKRYALKRMFVNKEQDLLMCQQEIRILESFAKEPDSPIVRYYASVIKDVDEEVKEILILLEYYKYSVLQLMNEKFQAKKNLSEEELLNIFCDVCHAVSKLHTHRPPWIHRDLKVENMLLDKNGRCVLCDFGSCTSVVLDPSRHPVADIEEDLKKYTTIAYRSPEMVNLYGFNKPITTKADIWALGVLLYKMCYFHLPFNESSLAIQNCNIHFPSHPAYSKHLQGLTRYCLQIDADERPDIYQVTQVACLLAGRECLVANISKSAVPSSEYLLKLCDTPIVPLTLHTDTLPAAVPSTRPPPHGPTSQHEISSVTSIAPRERPKPSSSSTNASLILLPPPLKPQAAVSVTGVSSAGPNVLPSEHAVERPSAAKLTGDRSQLYLHDAARDVVGAGRVNGTSSTTDAFNPLAASRRPVKLGHRRNISDTSAVLPTVRAISPTPTQNNSSERSRSADNSPTRSPHPGGSIDKKFANWNPFDDAEAWNVAPPPAPTLVQSITSSLTKVSSDVSGIASKLVPSSPTESRDSKSKLKEEKSATKKKKKFQYQKFDNDSEDELNTHSSNKSKSHDDDDNDSIGSASDLKYEEDTSDDDGTRRTRKISAHNTNSVNTVKHPTTKTDDEEDHMGYNDVQYGTLEETVSALRNVDPTSTSILQSEVSSKPLLGDGLNGMDKSDDDELSSASTVVVPQRRLTFDTAGLLSVFDQIPFRQPKKSKTSTSLKGDVSPTVSATNQNQTTPFPKTNPFAERSFTSPPHEERNLLRDFEASPVGPACFEPMPVKRSSHPPLPPPKPASLRKEGREALITLSSDVDRNAENRFGLSTPIKPFGATAGSVSSTFQSSIYTEHKQFEKSLLYDDLTDVSVTNELLSRKSPGVIPNKAGRFPVKKGISNVSFEDV
ncbi:hypothetical protein RvY_00682 [Ramazzottius varieornatus]|uniref:non-specific serine/threonine protein kinase n=1 Tax=Ramazzottius varieornatus TaxID=947166 RepID=A0A1D1UDM3_RAMVA|nr:hypothetical protein RvY_00682 [Ramazzottius varieornatus]